MSESTQNHKFPLPPMHIRTDSQTPKKTAPILILFISVCFIAAAVIAGVLFLNDNGGVIGTDSGVAACEQMAANVNDNAKPVSNVKMTEVQYQEKLAPFQNSKYSDIKVAGTNIMETVYQADQQRDSLDFGGALALQATLQTQWTQLQVACGTHGVTIPSLAKANSK